MLLRYIALHGAPNTEEEWENFEKWKARQLRAAECRMVDLDPTGEETCSECPGKEGCPKNRPPPA